jgi:uracil-DNA glycosylase family 4
VTSPKPRPGHLATYFRQQGELSGSEVFLDGLNQEEALRLAANRPARVGSLKVEAPEKDPAETSRSVPLSADYTTVRDHALACANCGLAETRNQVVFSDGNPDARLMVVGEAPGAQEDKTGMAFVGQAGKFLDLLLASIGLSREESVYICNVLKCRPPGNRNPLPGEIEACTPFLKKQIELISPEVILAVGNFAAQFLTDRKTALGKIRGEVYSYQGVPVVVTYHPAALLRNSGYTRPTWDDLQLLRQVMDGA